MKSKSLTQHLPSDFHLTAEAYPFLTHCPRLDAQDGHCLVASPGCRVRDPWCPNPSYQVSLRGNIESFLFRPIRELLYRLPTPQYPNIQPIPSLWESSIFPET